MHAMNSGTVQKNCKNPAQKGFLIFKKILTQDVIQLHGFNNYICKVRFGNELDISFLWSF